MFTRHGRRVLEEATETEKERERTRVVEEERNRERPGETKDERRIREVAGYATAFSWLVGDRKEVRLESRSCERGLGFHVVIRGVSEEERIAQVRSPVARERPSGGDGGGRTGVYTLVARTRS